MGAVLAEVLLLSPNSDHAIKLGTDSLYSGAPLLDHSLNIGQGLAGRLDVFFCLVVVTCHQHLSS